MKNEVKIAVMKKCKCGGKRLGKVVCPACKGTGEEDEGGGFGDYASYYGRCRRCFGDKKIDGVCECGGTGWVNGYMTGDEMMELLRVKSIEQ